MRYLGNSSLQVSPVALGCWPISGVTSLEVTREDSLATLRAAIECGINFFDTAFGYGYHGESELLIGEAIGGRRETVILATKGGLHFGDDHKIQHAAAPEVLRRECEVSLKRLRTDYVDLYYLHAPDPAVPVAESASAICKLNEEGKIRSAGASNLTLAEYKAFHAVCPLTAIQPPYNILMREIETDILPWCRENNIAVCAYWPLMKGLFAGKLGRHHAFDARDGRKKYPMFQGEEYQRNMDLVESLRAIADSSGHTVAQLVIAWTIRQEGITAALCGAKRPWQIEESAAAMQWELTSADLAAINAAIAKRGDAATRSAV